MCVTPLWCLAAWPLGSRRLALPHLCILWAGVWGNQVIETSHSIPPFPCPNGGSPRGDTPPSMGASSIGGPSGCEPRRLASRSELAVSGFSGMWVGLGPGQVAVPGAWPHPSSHVQDRGNAGGAVILMTAAHQSRTRSGRMPQGRGACGEGSRMVRAVWGAEGPGWQVEGVKGDVSRRRRGRGVAVEQWGA